MTCTSLLYLLAARMSFESSSTLLSHIMSEICDVSDSDSDGVEGDILRVADLAKINLEKSQIEGFRKDIATMVSFLRSLDQVLDKPEEYHKVIAPGSVREEDVVKLDVTEAEIFRNAKDVKNDYFVVPEAIEGK